MNLSDNLKVFIHEHASDDVNQLALRANQFSDIDLQTAIQQIKGRQIAKVKIPSWFNNQDILYPKHLSMEQCSSEYTALYKTELCSGENMVDLTGGFGVDFAFMSERFTQSTYVEQQQELTEIAKFNFAALGLKNVHVVNINCVDYLNTMERVDWIYLDPARRSETGRKTIAIGDCMPDIITIEDLLKQKSNKVMIKYSPMLDISLAIKSLNYISDVHVVSYNNECKELLFIKDHQLNATDILIHCVNLKKDKIDIFTFKQKVESTINLSSNTSLKRYLYEPNASIIKAGAYKSIANYYNIDKLHVNSHLYTSDTLIDNFHGRVFEIQSVSSLNKRELREKLKDVKYANVSTRNFPLNPQELKKRLNLKDGSDIYIFGTTLSDNNKVLLISKKL